MKYETAKYIRHCKQCGAEITEPLKVKDRIYMFCAATCKDIWDQEHAYKYEQRIYDGD